MKIWVKALAFILVLVMLTATFASCMPRKETNNSTPNNGTTNNGSSNQPGEDLPSEGGDNVEDNEGNNNHVGGIVVGNATAPYLADVYVSADVTPDAENKVPTEGVNLDSSLASATVPGGVQMAEGATELVLTVNNVKDSQAEIELSASEVSSSLDVHVNGVAASNAIPMEIKLMAAALKGLNSTSIQLYHVENGETIEMTYVPSDAEFTAHNQFKYDPATGDITLYIASFSEIAIVSNTVNAWEGEVDHSWYNANATELYIASAEQLWSFSQIVGGMAKDAEGNDIIAQDSFSGKKVILIADINLGDKESENNPDIIFYPIGYWNNEGTYERKPLEDRTTPVSSGFYNFCGTFEGNGHTISNFYQNTWEMKGDHDWYNTTTEQYYRDGMGLFGKVYGGTVKNLTVENFSSDGEITTTGVIAAYADGATFENISIFNCNPRVYNIGNGGIVGCVGWYAKEEGLKTTFTNITVDNTNKISALWGSYDVACGGILGQYYPTSGQSSANYPVNGGITFTNCHVSAIMDVYNDVCANYQYYAYRYTGMLIGSVRENETIDGRVYPKMDGIVANGCTVHFGTWNDYYYCELVANTTASYTHDHQMSRLTQVTSVDVENMKVTDLKGNTTDIPTSGRVNYVVVNGDHASENATCYHFVDGAVWNHEDAGYHNGENGEKFIDENGDGEADLKEDKQHIYLEFNNLFTGYGWGVTSKGLEDFEGVVNMDIKQGDHEFSVNKFESIVNELVNQKEFTLGDIFSFVNNGVPLKTEGLLVSITNLDKVNNPVSATIVYDEKNWENGTIIFEGTGEIQITIQDYYFCTPKTIDVTIKNREPEVKFESLFTGNFLYRVGNENAVSIQSLFKVKQGATIDTNNITITVGDNQDTQTWANAGIDFEGTGVITVTITDNDWCEPTVLTLEVINATNITGATTAGNDTSKNQVPDDLVLLNNCNFGSFEIRDGYTLYGNGFTMTCASDSYALDMGYSFVTLDNGTLDNVQIVCPNFDYAVLYKSNMTESGNRYHTDANGTKRYYNVKSGVMASGNSQILNSRISGGRAAVNVTGGNCLIDNSRIELGAVASLLVGAANSVTLRDVTLVQEPTASTFDPSKKLMGFSVLMVCNSEGNAASITLEGTLVQNAWVNEDYKQYVPSAGSSIVGLVLNKTDYLHDIDGDGTNESANLGFAFIPEEQYGPVNATQIANNDSRANKNDIPYEITAITAVTNTYAYVYSYKNTNGTNGNFINTPTYTPNKYSDIIEVVYSDEADGLTTDKSFGTTGWIYELNVDLDTASGYKLDFSKLSMVVNGVPATDFKVNGSAKPASPVAVTAGGVTYTLTATIGDKEYTATFKVTGTETTKESPSLVASNYESALLVGEAGNTLSKDTWHGAAPVLEGIQIKYWSVAEKQYKTINLSDYTPATAGKQNGTDKTWTYSPDNGDFTLTITGGQVHSSNKVDAMPVVFNKKLYFVAAASNGLVNYGNDARTIPVTYSFKDNNGGTELTFSHTWSIECANGNTAYDYSDFCNGTSKTFTIKSSNGNVCVTEDTLVMLANGTQKRIDQITYEDQLLVWNFFTGEYDVVPSAIIFNHGYDNYDVLTLTFSDDTVVKVLNNHGFYDVEENKFVFIDEKNAEYFIGHSFVKVDGDKQTTVKLVDYDMSEQYVCSYSIQTAMHNNFMVEGMFSITMPHYEGWFDYFEIGEGMKYDEEKMQADIAKYGLYSYEDFAEYVTYEQFIAFNGPYLKVLVGRGVVTYEQIIGLISMFVPQD